MAIGLGQNILDYGGTGGAWEQYLRDAGENQRLEYRQAPMDYSQVDFGTPPSWLSGSVPIVGPSGMFVGWSDPTDPNITWSMDAAGQWSPGTTRTIEGTTSGMGKLIKYSSLGALAGMAGYGALAGAGALGAAGAAGGSGAAAAPAGASWGLTGGAFGTGGAATAADVAAALGGGAAASAAPAAGSVPWSTGGGSAVESLWPGASTSAAGGGSSLGLTPEIASSLGLTPAGMPIPGGVAANNPGLWERIQQAMQGGGMPSGGSNQQNQGSGLGGLLGSLIGGGLGYLDAANQPNELTVRNEIDPRLGAAYYGPGGLLEQAQGIYGQQQGQPNYLGQAGQQITNLANTQLPGYNEAVKNNQGLWDSNPWVTQQQQAITNQMTRNLNENVMPGIGSQANAAGGYGGSRQGIAQGLAASRLNQDLAPALTGLASSAYENAQNRALQGAGTQLNYGLQNQAQTAGLLGTGAQMQQGAPWANFNQLANFTRGLPGGSSTTTPLFTNTTAGALGGANLGGQVGSSTNWGDIFQGVGSGFNWLNDIFRRS